MSELSVEQIAAITAAVVTVIVTAIMAARRSAQGAPPSEHPGSSQSPYLLLDAKQVQALIDALGINAAAAAQHRRAMERNTETARDVVEGADKLTDEIRELRVQLAISNSTRGGRG